VANSVWRSLLILAFALLAIATLHLSGKRIAPFSVLAIAAAALGFGPLTSALALGQIALPAFLFALPLRRDWTTIFAWAQPNVAVTIISRPLTFIASGTAFAIACVAVAGLRGASGYVQVLHDHGNAERFSAIQITPTAIAYGFGAPESAAVAIGVAVALTAIAAWIVLMLRLRDRLARFCITCALLPLAMPFFHEHDLLIAFVPAMVYILRERGPVFAFALLGALLCATDWLGLAQRPDGVLQTLLLIAAFAAAAIALRDDAHPRMLLAPLGVLLIIALAGWFAQTHAAPVWPDAMAAMPQSVRHLSVTGAWRWEQEATGLFARNAFRALLRCGSLAGCVLLAYAAVRSQFEIDWAFQKSMTGPGLIPRKSSL
jgi:hypothetical protein